jgi:hypothetical protein
MKYENAHLIVIIKKSFAKYCPKQRFSPKLLQIFNDFGVFFKNHYPFLIQFAG